MNTNATEPTSLKINIKFTTKKCAKFSQELNFLKNKKFCFPREQNNDNNNKLQLGWRHF